MSSPERLQVIRERLRALQVEIMLESADDLEEITDLLIDELLERLKLPGWIPFLKPWIRKKLDAFVPEGLFAAIEAAFDRVVKRRLGGPKGPLLGGPS